MNEKPKSGCLGDPLDYKCAERKKNSLVRRFLVLNMGANSRWVLKGRKPQRIYSSISGQKKEKFHRRSKEIN